MILLKKRKKIKKTKKIKKKMMKMKLNLMERLQREKYKIYGELLNAYGYSVPAGAESCQVLNYYTGENIRIPLDPTLTPQQNAQKYFDRYARMKRTNEALTRLTAEVSAEIEHLRSIQNALEFSTTDGDLSQIRREMEESGFLRRKYTGRRDSRSDSRKGRSRAPQSKPLHYISSDGYDIYVGKNNTQNDEITFHMADSRDIWFHANDMPGSHVLLKSGGRSMDQLPDRVFEEAAALDVACHRGCVARRKILYSCVYALTIDAVDNHVSRRQRQTQGRVAQECEV